ncbi:hypothetical protein RRG08_049669 [Elysia crispata]|uniref:Uncharacterized protein n=1 Tax=Elysia crispata TaxID=231223 RepID=A0AAE1CTT4_9GAST|nr:hypothetical protein RRG08_049669 [Elysia crispata]
MNSTKALPSSFVVCRDMCSSMASGEIIHSQLVCDSGLTGVTLYNSSAPHQLFTVLDVVWPADVATSNSRIRVSKEEQGFIEGNSLKLLVELSLASHREQSAAVLMLKISTFLVWF